ncbi:TPA: hypothetical protein MI570_27465 [Klebsiella pneumoniae]|nr:hypothetical protein [Klebsiella pneumoniae]
MKIKVENLGFISSGEIDIKDLTIIFGKNNVGKTYLSYATYGMLSRLSSLSEGSTVISKTDLNKLRLDGSISIDTSKIASKEIIQKINRDFTKSLSSYFNAKEDSFKETNIEIEPNFKNGDLLKQSFSSTINFDGSGFYSFNKAKDSSEIIITFVKLPEEASNSSPNVTLSDDTISSILSSITSNILLKNIFKGLSRPFVITSERTGISLFYKEMDSHRSSLIEKLITVKSNSIAPINKKLSAYSTPISDNINIIRQYESLTKRKSFLYSKNGSKNKKQISESLENILSGSFKHDNGETIFIKKENDRDISIPMPISSSSVKSLFLLDLYIKHIAHYGDFLVIDEPELNLHPENQVKMAELIVRLINSGIKIIMTTHSDYIIKEINNRIMLSNITEKGNLYDLDLTDIDALRQERVSAFTICDDGKIKEISVDKYGINQEIFDDVILSLNERSDLIYNALNLEQSDGLYD